MAMKSGRETTYTGAMIKVRALEDVISLIAVDETPLLDRVGLGSYPAVANIKYEWLEDALIPHADAVNLSAGWTATQTACEVDNAAYFPIGSIGKVESELIWVTGVDATNNLVHVVRAYAGTTGATHANDTVIDIVGIARVEGSSPGYARQVVTTQPYNVPQIFDEMVEVSGTEAAMDEYGVRDLLNYRMDKRMRELKMLMELSLLHGLRHVPTDNSQARVSGGLEQFITDKDDWGTGALLYTDVQAALKNAYDRVGAAYKPSLLVLNSTNKQALSDEFIYRGVPATGQYRPEGFQAQEGGRVAGGFIESLAFDFGTIEIMLDHLLGDSQAWLLNPEFVQSCWLEGRQMGEFDASIPGVDATRRRVLGELGWVVKNDGTHVWLYT